MKVGTKVVIIDNFDEHIGYIEGTIGTITEVDEYGYYYLDIGYCVSYAEIEIV